MKNNEFLEIKKKAEQGDFVAQNKLGNCYIKGECVEGSYEQAAYWYKKSAEQGYAAAQHNLGLLYYAGEGLEQSYEQALYWFKKSAEQGNPHGQNKLGNCYFDGVAVEQSYEQAAYWYKKAAEQGDVDSQFSLAVCYEEGLGVEQSYEQAVYWYKKSAEQGDAASQNSLGDCYFNGLGLKQSYEQAVYWYKKAAAQGDFDAIDSLGTCYYNGLGVEQSYEQAVYWYGKIAEQGDSDLQCILANCYEEGLGVEQSYEQAAYWYKKSADQGNVDALYFLGEYYYESKLYDEAIHYYQIAAEQGDVASQYSLAICYEEGLGVEQSYEQAVYWLKQASDQGDIQSTYYLALLYYTMPNPDLKNAKQYFEKCVSGSSDEHSSIIAESLYFLSTYYIEFDKDNGKFVNYFKAKELLEQSLEYYKKAAEEPTKEVIALLDTVNHILNIDDCSNNKMGYFANEISKKNIPIKDLFTEVDKVLRDKFQDLYGIISPYSKTCLTTSLLAYISLANVGLENYDKLDFSSVISPMTKMCEIELGRVFQDGFMHYVKEFDIPATDFNPEIQKFVVEKKSALPPLETLDNEELNLDKVNTKDYDYFKRKKYNPDSVIKYASENQFGGFTLGGIQKYLNIRQVNKPILGVNSIDKNGKSSSLIDKRIEMDEHLLNYFNLVFKDEAFKGNNRLELIKKYLYRFSQKVKNIAFELRNPSSHTQVMPYWKAVYCGNILFMKDNFIVDFLSKIKPEFLTLSDE